MKKIRLAVDIGSGKTSIYQVGGGVILAEPSIVAVSSVKNSPSLVGKEAKRLLGKAAKGTTVFSPVLEGEIDKPDAAKVMLKTFLNKIELHRFGSNVEVLVSVPCGTEGPAIKKLVGVFEACGIYKIKFIESPIAAAVGMGAPVTESNPCFVIDMGSGVTDIAAVSLGGVIAGVSAGIGGLGVDNMLIDYIEESYRLRIGMQTAERIKCEIGSLLPGDTTSMVINGRDIDSGNPRSMQILAKDVFEPIKLYVNKVHELSSMVMAKLPAEVSAEIRGTGIYLAGGLSKIIGLEEYFHNEFALAVKVCEDPEYAVCLGAGKIMENERLYKKLSFK